MIILINPLHESISIKLVKADLMINIDTIKTIFDNHGGIMRTSTLAASKIHYMDIQKLIHDGYIEKIRFGYYQWIYGKDISEANIISKLFPESVLCMNTALFYYRYSDRTPLEWNIAVDKDSSKSRFHIDYPFVKPYFVEQSLLELGMTIGQIDGYPVRIYDKERTICDCIRYAKKMDREIFNKAVQNYVNDSQKDIPKLIDYSKKLRVSKRVKDLIGVWL